MITGSRITGSRIACAVGLATCLAVPGFAASQPLKVFDCRRGSEIGSAVPHERLVWIADSGRFAADRLPKDRSDAASPGVVVLDFATPVATTLILNCTGLAKIAAVEADGDRLRIHLGGSDVRWRLDRQQHALVVWSPRQVYAELSRSWPAESARRLLTEARAMGAAPAEVEDLETRLDFEAYRKQGMAAMADGRHAEAAAQLQAAFAFVPNDIELGLMLARARYQLAQYDAAEELLESLISIAPQSAEVRHELGLLTLSAKRSAEAAEHFRAAAAAGGIKAQFYLGFLAFEAGDDAGAEHALGRFLLHERIGPLADRARRILEVVAARVAAAGARLDASVRPPVADPPAADRQAASPAAASNGLATASLPSLVADNTVLRGVNVPDLGVRSLRGRPAVVHFWAAWCPPCRTEMPSIRRFIRDRLPGLGDRRPAMVTVSMDYTLAELAGTLDVWSEDEAGALPPVYWDPNWQLALRLELGTALPQTLLVDADGQVVAAFVGAHDWQDGPLAAAIDALATAVD